MKTVLIVTLSLLLSISLFSQSKPWIGVSPGGSDEVNGIMVNLFPNVEKTEGKTRIKGLELEISPAAPLIFAITWAYAALDDHSWRHDSTGFEVTKEVDGVHLGLVNLEPSEIDGLEFNVLSLNSNCNGLSIAGFNIANEINGVSVGAIRNFAEKCNGVQIGLINESDDLKGFQFGLWNKNNKRSLPFINWNFSNDEESD